MKKSIIIILVLITLKIYCQNEEVYIPGYICKIQILTLDKKTQESVPLVLIEGYTKDKRIFVGYSDVDGKINMKICSNKLFQGNLIIKTTAINYKQDSFSFNIKYDTTLNLKMSLDSLHGITESEKLKYENSFILPCGTDEVNQLHLNNPSFRHCDGRVLSYRELKEKHEDLNYWEQIKNN